MTRIGGKDVMFNGAMVGDACLESGARRGARPRAVRSVQVGAHGLAGRLSLLPRPRGLVI